MKHVGKSTLARMLAQSFGRPFIDLDNVILQYASEETTRPLADIRDAFDALGQERFRALELTCLHDVLSRSDTHEAVVALGGGALDLISHLKNEAVQGLGERAPAVRDALLSAENAIVYLQEDSKRLWERVRLRGIPAYLTGSNPEAEFHAIAAARDSRFQALADVVVELEGAPLAEARRRVETVLRSSVLSAAEGGESE